ncbi:MAG: hypothetical protein KBS53_04375 [Bacteroidales bacterium]|nr:hypothetical protein [Candidatus Hennigimonas equi]
MKRLYIIALAAGALALVGCQRDDFASMEHTQSDAVVRFAPSTAAVSGDDRLTRSTAAGDGSVEACVLTSKDGSMSLPISCKVMSSTEAYGVSEDATATKASLINTTGDNAKKLSQYLTEFQVAAWEGTSGTTNFIPAGTKVKYITGWNPDGEGEDESFWSAVDGSGNVVEYIWKSSAATKTFFAWANLPANGASVACTGAAGQTLTLTALPDKDILMGFYQGDGSTGSPAVKTGTAGIHFYHPLTAVQFKKGILSDGVSITGISIEGVYTSGKTTQTSSTGTAFVWTKTDGSAFAASDETGTASLSDVTVDGDGFIGEAIVLIPQTFASNKARIAVSLSNGSILYTVLAGTQWKAGCTNIYTIGYDPLPEDLLTGRFSVSSSEYVQFSRGNLYCTRSGEEGSYTYEFGLERNQYDFRTRPGYASVINGVYDEDGTDPDMSGHFYWDIAKAQAGKDYGAFSTTAPSGGTTSDVLDWGPALDAASHWTTLSSTEWNYLLKVRTVKSATGLGNTCQFVIVKGVDGLDTGVDGLIIYPDDYDGDLFTKQQEITAIPDGCVFIPMAGKFFDGAVTNVNIRCNYWTSSAGKEEGGNAYNLTAYGTNLVPNHLLSRANGLSVRLVQKFKKPLPEIEFIDLGLPSGTLWADMNLGAYSEDDYGNYYAWGEVLPYHADGFSNEAPLTHFRSMTTGAGNTDITGYNSHTYSQNGSSSFSEWTTKPYNESTLELLPQYDAASYAITGTRTPSYNDWVELNTNCTWTWTGNHNGTNVAGYIVTSNIEGYTEQSIFLPATGIYSNVSFTNLGTRASYLSSTRRSDDTANAYVLYIHSTLHQPDYPGSRSNGFPVRAVKKKPVEYVEIAGLKWATCNVGANTPKDYGWYFFWGGTTGYKREGSKWVKASDTASELSGGFSWAKTPYHTGVSETTNWSKYIPTNRSTYWTGGGSPDNKLSLDPEDDAACANWGDSWRIPTQADFQTLYKACGGTGESIGPTVLSSANPGKGIYWVSAGQTYISEYNGVAGILFCDGTSKLFFVAAGYGDNTNYSGAGSEGRYWSGNVFSTNPQNAYRLGFQNGNVSPQNANYRYQGYPVRPVHD